MRDRGKRKREREKDGRKHGPVQKETEGQRHQRARGKKDARRLPPPGQQFSLSVTAGPSWAAATCIRLHKSQDRFTISLTNKRGSDRPTRLLHRDSYPPMQSTCSSAALHRQCAKGPPEFLENEPPK